VTITKYLDSERHCETVNHADVQPIATCNLTSAEVTRLPHCSECGLKLGIHWRGTTKLRVADLTWTATVANAARTTVQVTAQLRPIPRRCQAICDVEIMECERGKLHNAWIVDPACPGHAGYPHGLRCAAVCDAKPRGLCWRRGRVHDLRRWHHRRGTWQAGPRTWHGRKGRTVLRTYGAGHSKAPAHSGPSGAQIQPCGAGAGLSRARPAFQLSQHRWRSPGLRSAAATRAADPVYIPLQCAEGTTLPLALLATPTRKALVIYSKRKIKRRLKLFLAA